MTSTRTHPDTAWLKRLRSDIDEYLDHPEWLGSPTSSITGGGAIAAAEDRFARMVGTEFAVLMPSATYAMRAALAAVGVGPGDEVVVPGFDWTSTRAAVVSLGARPVPVAVTATSLTLDPHAVGAAVSRRTRAVVATHTHGVPADVPTLMTHGLPVVEDATGAFGARLDGRPVGAMGTAAVLSLGPGKDLDCGEGGVLLTDDPTIWEKTVVETTHPVRHVLNGTRAHDLDGFSVRVHPFTGVLAVLRLAAWDQDVRCQASTETVGAARRAGLQTLTGGSERTLTTSWAPVRLDPGFPTDGLLIRRSGARLLPGSVGLDPTTVEGVRLVRPAAPLEPAQPRRVDRQHCHDVPSMIDPTATLPLA